MTELRITKDFYAEVAAGNVVGHSLVHKYGRNPGSGGTIEEAVCILGDINFLQAATAVRIKAGGNAADVAGGAGTREVIVQGILDSGVQGEEAIVTAGASASSPTSALFWRTYRAWDSATGTYVTTALGAGNNVGQITIENAAGGTDLLAIAATEGQSQFAAFTIPAAKTGYLLSAQITVDANKTSDVIMWSRGSFTDVTPPVAAKRLKLYFDGVVGHLDYVPVSPQSLGSDTDVWWTFIPGSTGTECSVDFEILLIDN